MDLNLSVVACRVLGSLLEKEVTVPTTYPMTLNALVTAGNQTSGRDPILSLGEGDVTQALDELRALGLTRAVHASHGARSTKYRQVAHEVLELTKPQRAVLTVLLLRGPQTPGELRSRTERLHRFPTAEAVEEVLELFANRAEPLAVELPRRPGHKEQRWGHLLAGQPTPADEVATRSAATTSAAGPSSSTSSTEGIGATNTRETVDLHPLVVPIAALIGPWRGAGAGQYPTIEPFAYTEEIEFRAVPGKPFLAYRSATRHAEDQRPLHAESGFLRAVGDGIIELVVAQAPGLVEAAEGLLDLHPSDAPGGLEFVLESTVMAGSSTAKEVTATERRYRLEGDHLTYEIAMAAVGLPLTHHLQARLRRVVG